MHYKKINDGFYTRNYWIIDRDKNKWFSKYVKAKIFRKFIEKVNKNVLYDAGGGVGNWASYFINDFKKVIVSDVSSLALKRIPEKEIIKIKSSVLKNKLKSNSVDCILLVDVLEHIDEKDLDKMLIDLKRVLKQEGRLIICSSLFGYGRGMFLQRIFNPKKKLLGNEHREGHVNRLSFKEYKDLFKKTGLEIDNYYFYSIIFQQLTDSLKDSFAKISSSLLGKRDIDKTLGRKGQFVKEELRDKTSNKIFRVPLFLLSYISYLDILFFGKVFHGNLAFFSLKKAKE